jgi:hypothetical protein
MLRFVMRFLLVCSLVVAAPLEPSTKTWPLLSGHRALAQSTAPAAGASDQTAPSDAADDDATDIIHGAIAGGVTGTGAWLDSFFGTAHDQAENNKSRVRVSFGGFVEEGSDLGQRLQVKARLALPHTGKRLSLLVGGDGDDDSDLKNTANDEARENYNSTDSENAALGLQYFITRTKSSNLSAVAGLRIRKTSPVGIFGTRYRRTLDFDPWQLRFTQQALWLTDNGFSLPTRFDLDRPITDTVLSRTTLKGGWYESEKGYFYEANQSIIQRLGSKRGIRYEWNNQFQTSPRNRLEETNLRIRYRQAVWRDWLIFEIAPQLAFPRDRDFDATPGIYVGFEVRFGG